MSVPKGLGGVSLVFRVPVWRGLIHVLPQDPIESFKSLIEDRSSERWLLDTVSVL